MADELILPSGSPHPLDLVLDSVRDAFERRYPDNLPPRIARRVVWGLVKARITREICERPDYMSAVLLRDVCPQAAYVRPRQVEMMIDWLVEHEADIDPHLAEDVARAAAFVIDVGVDSILAEQEERKLLPRLF